MAPKGSKGKKYTILPLTRVEGHGKVTIHLKEGGVVDQARLHIVEFRGFERFILGRPFWEIPVTVQRLCGICPVSHHLAAAKAMDRIVGGEQLTSAQMETTREFVSRRGGGLLVMGAQSFLGRGLARDHLLASPISGKLPVGSRTGRPYPGRPQRS